MQNLEDDFIYSIIGKALISVQRVEFITSKLLEVLQDFDGGKYQITTAEFLNQTNKSKNGYKTLGGVFKLLKLNPKLVLEDELDSYLKKRNQFVHSLWNDFMQQKTQKRKTEIINFCQDLREHSLRVEGFFRGFVYFLSLRCVENKDKLTSELKLWERDFEYFITSLQESSLKTKL